MDFKRILEKLDVLDNRLDSVDKTLIKQEINLEQHMRRTEIAEQQINMLTEQIKPIQTHINYVEGVLKFMGILSLIVGLAAAVKSVFFS